MRQIARIIGCSHQWVSQYVQKNYGAFAPLLDNTDSITALKSKRIADIAQDKLIEHLPKATQKDLVALNITAGTQIDKYRLLTGQSTENVAIDAVGNDIKDLDDQASLLEARIMSVTGGANTPQHKAIEGQNGEE